MNAMEFHSSNLQVTFTQEARDEIGADRWFIILHDQGEAAVVATETGALYHLRYNEYDRRLTLTDKFEMCIAERVEVLHNLTRAQKDTLRELKRAKKAERPTLLRQARALRQARQCYDQLVASCAVIIDR